MTLPEKKQTNKFSTVLNIRDRKDKEPWKRDVSLSVIKYANQFHKFRICWRPCGGRKHASKALSTQTSQAGHLYRTHCAKTHR